MYLYGCGLTGIVLSYRIVGVLDESSVTCQIETIYISTYNYYPFLQMLEKSEFVKLSHCNYGILACTMEIENDVKVVATI